MSSIVDDLGQIRLDSRTKLMLDSFGTLSSFDTKVQLNDLPLVVKVFGRVDGPELQHEVPQRRRVARGRAFPSRMRSSSTAS